MQRTVLVTGAAGFIGSHLCEALISRGHRVVGVDAFSDYYPRAYKELNLSGLLACGDFRLHEVDLLALGDPTSDDAGLLRRLVREADTVFHLAAQAGVRGSWGQDFHIYTDNNVLVTQMLLELVKQEGVERFVYASTSSVYGDTNTLPMREDAICHPFSPYGVSKLAGEHLCYLYGRNFGVPTVAVRFFTVFGERQRPDMAFHRFIRLMRENKPIPIYGDGSQTRDFTYVSDIADGLVAAASAPSGELLNLGGGSRVSLLGAIAVLGEVLGFAPELDIREKQAGDVRDTWASLEHSNELIGYRPRVSLSEGLAAEAEWLRLLSREPGFPWGVEL